VSGDREILYGVHPVREALRAGRRRALRLHVRERDRGPDRPDLRELAEAARRAGVPVVPADAEALAALVGPEGRTQGVVLEAGPLPEADLDALAGSAGAATLLVALDGVEDPQNVGAVVRVAEAAGAAALVLTRRHAPPLSAALARASAGAVEWLPVARVANLARALASAQAAGLWLVGADPAADTSLFEAPDGWLTGPTVLVLGAEGRGLRSGIERRLDHRVRIPMEGSVHSLNVASAAAVLLYELLRRRA